MTEAQLAEAIDNLDPQAVADLLHEVERIEESKILNPLIFYKPTKDQDKFHKLLDDYNEVLFSAGNSSGKTYALMKEVCCYLLGEDPSGTTPLRKYPKPERMASGVKQFTHIWVGATSTAKGGAITDEYLMNMLPKGIIKRYIFNRNLCSLELKNGTKMDVKSYESDARQWQSDSIDYAAFDEQPPFEHYNETRARVARRNGKIAIASTPLYTNSIWMFWEFIRNLRGDPNLAYLMGSTLDNEYLTEEAKQRFLDSYSGSIDEDARIRGVFAMLKGIVHKSFDPAVHVIPAFPITDSMKHEFEFGRLLDLHPAQPEVCQWVMFKRNPPMFYVIRELRVQGNFIIPEFARRINEITQELGVRPSVTIIDTPESSEDRTQHVTMISELARHGVVGIPAVRSLATGIERFNSFLTTPGRFFVFDECKKTQIAIQDLRWADPKGASASEHNAPPKVVDKDMHEIRNLHYMSIFLPPINMMRVNEERKKEGYKKGSNLYNLNYQRRIYGGDV